MSITESTIKNAPDNNEIKIEGNEKRKVPKGMPKVPMTLLVVGKKGAGKTHAIANMVRKYQSVVNYQQLLLKVNWIKMNQN